MIWVDIDFVRALQSHSYLDDFGFCEIKRVYILENFASIIANQQVNFLEVVSLHGLNVYCEFVINQMVKSKIIKI